MTSYVINNDTGYVCHVGNRESCDNYVYNAGYLFGGNFSIATGAAERDRLMKDLKSTKVTGNRW